MAYFVNEFLFERNSSVEHTEFKRLALFAAHKHPAKIVLTGFAPNLYRTLDQLGIPQDQVLSLYDFFGDTQDVTPFHFHLEDLHLPDEYIVGSGNNFREVRYGDQLIAEVHFFGGTFGQVEHVDWYDRAGQLTKIQRYDIRGFKVAEEFYGTKAKEKYYVRFYRPNGTVFLESYFVESTTGTPINSELVLRDYQGQDYFFGDPSELVAFFLDELNRQAGGNQVFIADRPGTVAHPMLMMKSKARRYLWLATNQVASREDPRTAAYLDIYTEALSKPNLKHWAGLIVATDQQAADLKARVGKAVPIYTISPATEQVGAASEKDRLAGQVIAVGRTGDDKGTPALIQAFKAVHASVPNAKLTIYGYGGDHAAYQQQIEAAGLAGVVTLADYRRDLTGAYGTAQLFVDTSESDNLPLAMGEALAHGLPVVSYDYQYGPAELVDDSCGRLVKVGAIDQLTKQITTILLDDKLRQKLAAGALEKAKQVTSGTAAWAAWEQLLA